MQPSNLNLPYVLIVDKAYPLKNYLMRPYPPGGLNAEQIIFDKTLSRASVTIQYAFGILTNKFRIFTKSVKANKKHAILIIKVSCLKRKRWRQRCRFSAVCFPVWSLQYSQ
ncbi:transposase family protein [Pseudomonas aeruginosa]|nr:transposase family protein [Pseudomonas aeruginosa]